MPRSSWLDSQPRRVLHERAWNVGLRTPFFWKARVPLLLAVVALSSVGAHMPARYRNYSVLRRHVVIAEPRPGP